MLSRHWEGDSLLMLFMSCHCYYSSPPLYGFEEAPGDLVGGQFQGLDLFPRPTSSQVVMDLRTRHQKISTFYRTSRITLGGQAKLGGKVRLHLKGAARDTTMSF